MPSRRVRLLSLYKQQDPGTSRYHRIASVSCNFCPREEFGFWLSTDSRTLGCHVTIRVAFMLCNFFPPEEFNFLLSTESNMLHLRDLFQHVVRFSSAGMISASWFSHPGFTSAAWPSYFIRIEGVPASFCSHLMQGLGCLGSANSRQDCAVGN